ncbi:hypothetical protein [Collinsella tanakaei]|uniref:hypothetical protein n=1 Tax=Collinsella tanakaei TaxID=626935 RepID=UPI001F2737B0|nr:hypothetical protein [Collinsella tanakaei]MCF2622216.1 hypothetical protein [Collinsella tanakaei]
MKNVSRCFTPFAPMGLFTFQVDDKGQIVNESGEGYTVGDGKLTIVANDTPIEAKIVKTDEAGISLPGATFTITNTADADDVKTVTTDRRAASSSTPTGWSQATRTPSRRPVRPIPTSWPVRLPSR